MSTQEKTMKSNQLKKTMQETELEKDHTEATRHNVPDTALVTQPSKYEVSHLLTRPWKHSMPTASYKHIVTLKMTQI